MKNIVSREEWLAARRLLLVKEKNFSRLYDHLAAERRALPWVKVEKEYVFEAPEGRRTLAEHIPRMDSPMQAWPRSILSREHSL